MASAGERAEASAAQEPSSSEASAGQRAEATAAPQPSLPTSDQLRSRGARAAWHSNFVIDHEVFMAAEATYRAEAAAAPQPSLPTSDRDRVFLRNLRELATQRPDVLQTLHQRVERATLAEVDRVEIRPLTTREMTLGLDEMRQDRVQWEPTDPTRLAHRIHEAFFMAYQDRHDRQVRLERAQRDLVQCELSYRVWAPTASWQMGLERLNLEVLEPRPTRRELARTRTTRELAETLSWFGTPAEASLDEALERPTFEVLQPRLTRRELARRELAETRIEEWAQQARAARRELAETRIEELLQQALAAELSDILSRRPEFWDPEPASARLARTLCRAVLARRLEARQEWLQQALGGQPF